MFSAEANDDYLHLKWLQKTLTKKEYLDYIWDRRKEVKTADQDSIPPPIKPVEKPWPLTINNVRQLREEKKA